MKVRNAGKKHKIALPVKENLHIRTNPEIFKETLASLLDAANTLQLNCLRISKTDGIDDIPWARFVDIIKDQFADWPTKIILCKNLISHPRPEVRNALTKEIHCSHVNGHRGVAKTYKRMRQAYFWSGMKSNKLKSH